jgi:hypothetical protein
MTEPLTLEQIDQMPLHEGPVKRRGRKRGGRNKPGHHAGRPRKHPVEVFHPSIWSSGRAEISVEQKHLDAALRANSSHCAIAFAIRDAVPNARRISVDLQTIRWTDSKRGVRYCFLTPHVAQQDVIIPFDQGEACHPVTFRMRPAFVTRSGAGYARHTPDADQLKGTGLKVAEEQPHIPGAPDEQPQIPTPGEAALAEVWKPKSVGPNGALVVPLDDGTTVEVETGPKPSRKPRQPRAKISHTKPDGSIPVTLGGKLPPKSVLARREFGLRQVRR